MQLFCLQLEASCLQSGFFACSGAWELFCLQLQLFSYSSSLLLTIEAFYLQWVRASNKHLKETVSKEAPTVSKKLPHFLVYFWRSRN